MEEFVGSWSRWRTDTLDGNARGIGVAHADRDRRTGGSTIEGEVVGAAIYEGDTG